MKLKKLFALSLGIGLGVSLLSCGNNNNTTKSNVDSTTTTVNTTTAQTTTVANTTTVNTTTTNVNTTTIADTTTTTVNTTTIADTTTTTVNTTTTPVNTTTVANTTTAQTTTTNEQLYVKDKGIDEIKLYEYSSSLTTDQIENDLSKKFETNGTVTHGEIIYLEDTLITVEYRFTKNGQTETKYLSYFISIWDDFSDIDVDIYPMVDSNIETGLNYYVEIDKSNNLCFYTFIFNPNKKNITIYSISSFRVRYGGKEVANGSFSNVNLTIDKDLYILHTFRFSDWSSDGIPSDGTWEFLTGMTYKINQ